MTGFHVIGHGIVGRRVQRMLDDVALTVHDPRRPGLDRVQPGDVVIAAHAGPHAGLAGTAVSGAAHFVSVGDGLADTHSQLALDETARRNGVCLVVGAAMTPGLGGLLARHLAAELASVDEIHLAVHGTAGPACARAHHMSLRLPSLGLNDGSWVEHIGGSGRELCWFPEPIGARDCYRAENTAPLLLQRAFPDSARISFRRSATRRDRLTAPLPMLRRPHREGGVGALRVELRGAGPTGERLCLIAGVAELVGTAAAATAAAFATACAEHRLPAGAVIGGDADLPNLDLLRRVERFGVRLQSFTGIPVPTTGA